MNATEKLVAAGVRAAIGAGTDGAGVGKGLQASKRASKAPKAKPGVAEFRPPKYVPDLTGNGKPAVATPEQVAAMREEWIKSHGIEQVIADTNAALENLLTAGVEMADANSVMESAQLLMKAAERDWLDVLKRCDFAEPGDMARWKNEVLPLASRVRTEIYGRSGDDKAVRSWLERMVGEAIGRGKGRKGIGGRPEDDGEPDIQKMDGPTMTRNVVACIAHLNAASEAPLNQEFLAGVDPDVARLQSEHVVAILKAAIGILSKAK